MFPTLLDSLRDTLVMVLSAGLLSILIGIPLGTLVASIAASNTKPVKGIYYFCYTLMQIAKFSPYLLIMLLFLPVTNWLINNQVTYTNATILPLAAAGSLLLARKVYDIMYNLAQQWLATTKAMGANLQQTIWLILLPEGLPDIIRASAHTCSLIVGFTTIAGALGAGGLGQLAIEKSISQPDPIYVILCLAILVVLQQLIEYTARLVIQQTKPR